MAAMFSDMTPLDLLLANREARELAEKNKTKQDSTDPFDPAPQPIVPVPPLEAT